MVRELIGVLLECPYNMVGIVVAPGFCIGAYEEEEASKCPFDIILTNEHCIVSDLVEYVEAQPNVPSDGPNRWLEAYIGEFEVICNKYIIV